jgi:hypothetical protein
MFGAALLALAAVPQTRAAAEPGAPVTVRLRPYLGTLYQLDVQIAGRTEPMLLDTAGGVTVLSPAASARSGCRPAGRVTGHRMRGQRVDMARCDRAHLALRGRPLRPLTTGVFDIGALLPSGAPVVAGSLALDAFDRPVTIDLSAGTLTVETAASLKRRLRGAVEVEASFAREMQGLSVTPFVGLAAGDGLLWLELDSGSDAAAIVADHAAPLLGLRPGERRTQPLVARLGPGLAVPLEARTEDLVIDGNLGIPVLKRFIITMDQRRGRIWLKRRSGG